jgi:hypothetical protein
MPLRCGWDLMVVFQYFDGGEHPAVGFTSQRNGLQRSLLPSAGVRSRSTSMYHWISLANKIQKKTSLMFFSCRFSLPAATLHEPRTGQKDSLAVAGDGSK